MTPRRVATSNAVIPQPSDELFDTLARRAFEAWTYDFEADVHGDWSKLPPDEQTPWVNVARDLYAIIAERGGGKVTQIGGKP